MSQPAGPPPNDRLGGAFGFAKGLTLGNSIAILVLLLGLVPAYIAYRLVSDPALIDRFLSSYSVEQTGTACRVVKARQRGEDYTYGVVSGFAFEGQDRWSIGVTKTRDFTEEELKSYCALLQTIIDFMHGSSEPPNIIWQQKDIEGREGLKGER